MKSSDETIIIIDSNILIANKPLKNIKVLYDKNKQIADVFIPETVLDELTMDFYNHLNKRLIPSLENNFFLYELLDIEYKLPNSSNYQNYSKIKKVIENIFEENIIPLQKNLDRVYNRALHKIPPFNKLQEGDSGFKDTMIWTSILDYSYEKYTKIIFVTQDRDFTNYKKDLEQEFEMKHGKIINIYRNLPSESLPKNQENKHKDNVMSGESNDKKDIKDVEQILKDHEAMSGLREELDLLLDEMLSFPPSPYDQYHHQEPKFQIDSRIDINNFDEFKQHLYYLISNNIMSERIQITDFLNRYSETGNIIIDTDLYPNSETEVPLKLIASLLKILDEIDRNLPRHKAAVLKIINEKINQIIFVPLKNPFANLSFDKNPLEEINEDDMPF